MKILVITQYYYPEDFRINDICENLVNRGHEVTVVTGIPNYPKGEIFEGYESNRKKTEIINGVKIVRCNNSPRHSGAYHLFLNYITYVIKASREVNKLKDAFDIIYVYQLSPISLAIPGIKYKKKAKIPLCYYVLDIWPASVRDLGNGKLMSVKNPIYKITKWFSKKIYSKADLLLLKCNEFGEYLHDVCNIDSEKFNLLFEHAEQSYLQIDELPQNNGILDFMFLGNMGHASNCEIILRAVTQLHETTPYMVHFVGDGSELEHLKELARRFHVEEHVIFHGRHPQSEINSFYNIADVCLLTLSNETAIGLTPPAKLTGYLAASRPIIGAIDGSAKTIINSANCGFVTSADDVNGFVNLMQNAIDHPEILNGLGQNGRKYFIEHFTLDKHIEGLEQQLQKLISQNK